VFFLKSLTRVNIMDYGRLQPLAIDFLSPEAVWIYLHSRAEPIDGSLFENAATIAGAEVVTGL
jgi:hypothetical protein